MLFSSGDAATLSVVMATNENKAQKIANDGATDVSEMATV